MSGSGFPTVGLDVDLTKVDGAQAKLAALRAEFKGIGAEAQAASVQIAKANAAIAGEGAAPTSKLNTLSEARLKVARDVTAGLEAETTKQQLLAQKTVSAEAAALVQIQRDAQAFVEVRANLKAAADAKLVAAEAAYNEKMAALVQQGLNDAQLMQVRQGVAELAELQAQNDKKLAMQRAYLNAQMRLTADAQIAQGEAAAAAAQAAYAAGKARTDAADRATTGVATGSAGFAVSGDAEAMAASIAATNAALKVQGDMTAYVAARDVELAAAQAAVTVANTEGAAAAVAGATAAERAAAKYIALGVTLSDLKAALGETAHAQQVYAAYVAQSGNALGLSAQEMERLTEKVNGVRAALDPAVRAQQVFAAQQAVLNDGLKAGIIDVAEHARQMQLAEGAMSAASAAAGGLGLKMREITVVIRELMRGDFSRLAGSLSILGQAFGVLTAQVIAAALPWAILTAVILGAVAAVSLYAENQRKVTELANGVGAAVGATAGQIHAASEAGAAASNVAIGTAEKWAETYVRTGKISGDVLVALTAYTNEYAEATGVKAAQANQELAAAFADPAKGAETLNDKLHFLNQTQLEHIENLAKSGDLMGAQQELQKAFSERMDETATHAEGLAAAFMHVINNIRDMGRDIGNALTGADVPLEKKIAALQKNISTLDGIGSVESKAEAAADRVKVTQLQTQLLNDNYARLTDADNMREKPGGKISNQYDFTGSQELAKTHNDLLAAQQSLTQAQSTDEGKVADYQRTVDNLTVAYQQQQKAIDSGLSPAVMRQNLINDATDAKAKATTNSQKAAAAQALVYAQSFGRVADQALLAAQAHGAYDAALDKAHKTTTKHQQSIESGISALVADAQGALAAARAYDENTAAGNRMEAARRAVEKATKDGMNTDQAARDLIAQETDAAAKQVEAWAKATTALNDHATARTKYNGLISAGLMTTQAANDALTVENALRDKSAALIDQGTLIEQTQGQIARASQAGQTAAVAQLTTELETQIATRDQMTTEIERQTAAEWKSVESQRAAALLARAQNDNNKTALTLMGASMVATPGLASIEGAKAGVINGLSSPMGPFTDSEQKAIDAAEHAASATQKATLIQEAYNAKLVETRNALLDIAAATQQLASGMASAFGSIGQGLGSMLTGMSDYAVSVQTANNNLDAQKRKTADVLAQEAKGYADIGEVVDALYLQGEAQKRSDAEGAVAKQRLVDTTINGFKQMAGQGSAAYKVLTGLEMAYRAIQLAGSIQSIVQNAAETASAVGNSIAQAASWAAAGAAKMFSQLGVFAFPAVAAMVGVLAALGARIAGGGGGGAAVAPSAADLQKAAGTGSMLGDPTAKSDSIAQALSNAQKYQDKQLGYSSVMTKSLQSIDANIAGFTTLIARQLGVSGAFGTGGLGLGTTSSHGSLGTGAVAGGLAFAGMAGGTAALMSGFAGALALGPMGLVAGAIGLAIAALVKTTVTTALTDQGLNFPSQTVGAIGAGGFAGSTYQDVSVSSHKSLLGIGLGTSTKNVELSGALPDDFQRQATLIIQSLRSGILTAASTLGVDGAQAAVDAFTVDLGRISIKDLSTSDIQAELEAVFSKAGDDMASAAAPFLANFQKAGEGLFQTLSRVATDYATIDTTLASIGKSFGATGLASIGARENLLGPDLFGSLDTFTSQVSAYADKFLTDAEKLAPVQAAVSKAMADMGYASVATKDQFKALVHSLDLTTADGQKTFAALLAIAPAFAQVADAADAAASANADAAAAALQAQQAQAATNNNLLVALFQAQGMTPEATGLQRKLTLDGITDPTQKALQQAVYDAQDRQAAVTTAATAAQTTLNAALQRAQSLYQAQAQTLQGSIDQFKQLGATLRDARAQLDVSNDNLSPLAQLANAQEQFAKILDTAKTGSAADSAAAMGQLTGAGSNLLQLAQQYAPSYQDYQRVLSTVKKGYEDTADVADQQVSIAQQQLDALTEQAKTLGLIDTGVTDLNTAFGVLAQAIAAAANVGVKDPQWGAVQNMAANKALAAATGYAGAFGGGGFDQFIQTADLATRSNARDVLTQFGQTSRVDFSTADPQWGDYHNVDANKALAAALGYTGAFGGGGFDAWIKQQGPDAKSTAAGILRQFGEASRVDFFANGTMLDQGIVTRPTAFAVAGEAGPEGILPLANVGGKLGVRAAGNDNGLAAAVNAVRDELAQMRLEQEQLGLNQVRLLASLDRRDEKWDGDGLPATRSYG